MREQCYYLVNVIKLLRYQKMAHEARKQKSFATVKNMLFQLLMM